MALRLRPTEYLLAGYGALGVAAGLARADQPGAIWVAAGHGLLMALAILLPRVTSTSGRALRDLAPILLLPALYAAIDVLNNFGARPVYDSAVQAWEAQLFGGQPSRDWWRLAPSHVWSTVLHAAYFVYYVIVPVPVILSLSSRRRSAGPRAVFVVMTAFLVCYACFVFLPVAGPYYEFTRPTGWFVENGPARLVYGTLASGSSYGAAFPSSHIAGTWAAIGATAAMSRVAAAVLAVPGLLLTVGVVYCQMHYVMDVIAGLAIAGLALGAARALYGNP